MRKFFTVLASCMLLSSEVMAQNVTPPIPPQQNAPYWRISLITTNQALTGSFAVVAFNSKTATGDYDPSGVCNITTGICTPNVAGAYSVSCVLEGVNTVGPASVGNVAIVENQVWKNGAAGYGDVSAFPQVASLANVRAVATTNAIVQVNGSTDTLSCAASTNATTGGAVVAGAGPVSYMVGYRTGAQ